VDERSLDSGVMQDANQSLISMHSFTENTNSVSKIET